ncbi:UNVERIFIED_ORG: hypothetical protein FHW05_004709 [Pantoea agglomerans]
MMVSKNKLPMPGAFKFLAIKSKPLILCLLMLNLTGCVSYKWVKQGADDGQTKVMETECKSEALVLLPPSNVVVSTSTSKDKKTGEKETNYYTEDLNESQRDTVFEACMLKHGWEKVELKN